MTAVGFYEKGTVDDKGLYRGEAEGGCSFAQLEVRWLLWLYRRPPMAGGPQAEPLKTQDSRGSSP